MATLRTADPPSLSKMGARNMKLLASPRRVDSEFELLGRDMLEAMTLYVNYLRKDGLPEPSLEPSTLFAPALTDLVGLAARMTVVEIAQKICAMAMDPQTNLLVNSLQFHFCSCLKVAIDLRIHEYVPSEGSIPVKKLAKAVGAEDTLIVRIMRVLTDKFIFEENRPGFYRHTAMSAALNQPKMADLLSHRLDEVFKSASNEADALAQTGYTEPNTDKAVGFNIAFDTKAEFWKYINDQDPKGAARRDRAMPNSGVDNINVIPEMYSFDQLAAHGGLLVDVGGGSGMVAEQILSYDANLGLRCVVQDLWATNSLEPNPRIRLQKHDFFKEQPIKGAAAYFFRHVLHQWPDEACRQILRQIVDAMDPERSRILICDQVVCGYRPTTASLLCDIDMLTLSGGKERTLSEWVLLINSADPRLYVSDVRKTLKAPVTILEVMLGSD